jgi:hypothetical protein
MNNKPSLELQYLVARDHLERKWAEINIQALYEDCSGRRLIEDSWEQALGNLNLEFGLPWDYNPRVERRIPLVKHKPVSRTGNDFMCM